jgi:type I restriction enzyme S subunit
MTEWQVKKVGDIADTQLGKMLNKGKQSGKHAKPYLRTDNVHWGRFDLSEIKEMDILPEEQDKYLATKGDLLMCEGGASGRTAIWNEDYDISFQNHVHRIRPKDLKEISPKYLLYYFEWFIKNGFASDLIKGVTISSLSQSGLRSIEVTYPTIDEQHKIVELLEDHLSRLDAALADVKLAKIKAAQFRNVYIDYFLKKSEGIKTNLASILKFSSGFAYKSSIWQDTGMPVVKIMNVKHREVNLDGCSFVSPEVAENSKSFAVRKGDLLFNMTGATLGAFGFYNLEQEARMNQRVGKFVPLNLSELSINYLAYVLESASTQRMIQQLAKGAAQPNISPRDILSLEINLPDIAMQNAIVEELDAGLSKVIHVDQLCNSTEAESKALRRSLLKAAFTGQLTKEVVNV